MDGVPTYSSCTLHIIKSIVWLPSQYAILDKQLKHNCIHSYPSLRKKAKPLQYRLQYGHLQTILHRILVAQLLRFSTATCHKRCPSIDEAINRGNHTQLHLAALNGHITTVQQLLKNCASTEAMDRNRVTILVQWNYFSGTVPQPKPRINDNYTPLHHAANCGHTGIVKQLLKKGASVEAIDTNGCTEW